MDPGRFYDWFYQMYRFLRWKQCFFYIEKWVQRHNFLKNKKKKKTSPKSYQIGQKYA
jgi:hypothetical protein